MRVIAKKAFSYGGRALTVGEEFNASARDARVLCALGRADTAPPLPRAESEIEPPEQAPPDEPKPARRQYRRRDMVAEET
ncbi:MAG: hypothetical protein KBG29_08515 [Pseudomonadales bacterium]|nr:hypothetical protein [Pseudomonadales bacterium]